MFHAARPNRRPALIGCKNFLTCGHRVGPYRSPSPTYCLELGPLRSLYLNGCSPILQIEHKESPYKRSSSTNRHAYRHGATNPGPIADHTTLAAALSYMLTTKRDPIVAYTPLTALHTDIGPRNLALSPHTLRLERETIISNLSLLLSNSWCSQKFA